MYQAKVSTYQLRTLTGNNLVFEVSSEETVGSLKVLIQARAGIPLAEQHLVFNGFLLEDVCTLNDYGIQRESTLHLVFNGFAVECS
jgi:hypothetical protein